MARTIALKSAQDLGKAREAGRLAAEVLAMIGPRVVPGVSTEALDRPCHEHIVGVQGTVPANVGYLGYPKTILTSVNHVVCHGIPSARRRTRCTIATPERACGWSRAWSSPSNPC
ncbi:Metallopeptidase family M24 [Paracidovorax cattleyae]|uniref:Metallopeptidase family M24 n=1 Tax=Paracidovorax cattleyae TaxID=80868 RepID=A0A1H0RF27_9BURK|nr:Metallopeptidase family M24 [Paracidovorax cattleyae]